MTVNILGVATSLRKGAFSTKTLKAVLELAKQKGANTRLLDLREANLPLYAPDGNDPEQLDKVSEDVKWAEPLFWQPLTITALCQVR